MTLYGNFYWEICVLYQCKHKFFHLWIYSFLIGLHIDIVLNIYYICTVFFIAEMALTMPCSFYMLQKYSSNVFKTCFYFSFPIFYMDVYQRLFFNISGWSYFLNSKFAICTYFAWLNSCMFTDLIWPTQNVTWLYFFFIRHVYCFFMSQVLVF